MVEYALLVALVVVVLIGALQYVTDEGGDELADRGGRAGAPDVDTNAAPTTTTTSGGGSGSTVPPPPVSVELEPPTVCWEAGNGSQWSARFTVRVRDVATGDAVAGAVVTIDLVTTKASGATSSEPIGGSTSGPDGLVVITKQQLKTTGSNAQVDVAVSFTVTGVSGPGLSYVLPTPAPSAQISRSGATC
jgi:hypothetical protein